MSDSFARPHKPIKIESSTLEAFRLKDMAFQLATEEAYLNQAVRPFRWHVVPT